MPINNDSLNKNLYSVLKTHGYNPIPKDATGKSVPVPNEADVFKFTFKDKQQQELGPAWITIENGKLKVYYDDKTMSDLNESDANPDDFINFLKQLKKWAQRRQLGFELENEDHLASDMAQREYMKKENISEGYYPMGKSASYNDNVPTVKIILQHTRQIQEGEQRFRNIARIFLENTQGERFLAPTIRPGIAQVYARHLAEGGVPNDERWNHIKSLCEEYSKMAGFVRAVRGNQFNESAQRLVEAGLNHYTDLRESLGKMRGHRGYNAYFESWTPTLMETEGDESNLNELFVQETLDPRIESVMPILNRLKVNLGEMKEVEELAEWADNLTEAPGAETFKYNKRTATGNLKALGLAEEEIDEALSPAELAKMKIQKPAFQRTRPGQKLSIQDLRTARQMPPPAPEDPAKGLKISSREGMAALTKRLQDIGQLDEVDMDEGATMPTNDPRYNLDRLDPRRMGGTLKDRIKQRTGQDVYGQGRAAAGMPAIHDYANKPHLPEEEVEESGLQAYLGNKKYGKKGMDALRKAGRDGASKEKMASIRAKYDKLDEQGVAEGVAPEIDRQATFNYAMKMVDALNGRFHGNWFDYKRNDDGSITIVKKVPWIDEVYQKLGYDLSHPDLRLSGALTGKNFNDAINPWYKEFRSKGWRFDQPVGGSFGIAVNKQQGVAEDEFAGDFKTGPEGQWRNKGPKANKPAKVGDLVGASESIEAKLKAITEMDKSQPSSDRGGESSGNPYAKGGKATPKPTKKVKKDFLGVLKRSVAKANQAKKDTDDKVKGHMKEGQEDLEALLKLLK